MSGLCRNSKKAWFAGWHTPNRTSGNPNGTLAPASFMLPIVGGGLSSYNEISGLGNINSANLAGGLNAISALTGSGDITTALGALVVSAIAALVGSGDITSASMVGKLEAIANLAGSGNLSGAIGALAGLVASLSGSGSVSSATPYATGAMGANIRGYSDLTPEGLRDAVWRALSASYNEAGTMGNKLNSAASGGIDYAALAAAILAAAAIDPIASNVKQVNDTDINGSGTSGDPWGP